MFNSKEILGLQKNLWVDSLSTERSTSARRLAGINTKGDVVVLDRSIDVHIMALRRKLGKYGSWIETIRGFGCKFREESTLE